MPDKQRPPSESDIELLSALIDGMLSDSEHRELQTRLDQEPELQAAYADLQRTVSLLKSLPAMRAPRNFTLTPEMVGLNTAPLRAVQRPRRSIPFAMTTAFSALSAAAAAILLVIGASMLTLNTSAPQSVAIGMLTTGTSSATQLESAPADTGLSSDVIGNTAVETASPTEDTTSRSMSAGESPTEIGLRDEVGSLNALLTATLFPTYSIDQTQSLPSLSDANTVAIPSPPITDSAEAMQFQQTFQQAQANAQRQATVQAYGEASMEAFSQGLTEDSSIGAGGGAREQDAQTQGGVGAAAAGAAASSMQDILPTMSAFPPAPQGTLSQETAPLVAMQPFVQPLAQPPAQPASQVPLPSSLPATATPPPTATKSLPPTATTPPSDTPSSTSTVTLTATPTLTFSLFSVDGTARSSSTSIIFGIALIGTALFFAALAAASVWARRRFNRSNSA